MIVRPDEAVRSRWEPCGYSVLVLGRLRGPRILFHRGEPAWRQRDHVLPLYQYLTNSGPRRLFTVCAVPVVLEDVVPQHLVPLARQP